MNSRGGSGVNVGNVFSGIPEKSGWLAKWTNYIKGYRQRWFVLDSNAVLSYYRNQQEVGESCRGSINLHEARVLSDKVTNNIVIAHSSQTFHLKAQNDIDREQWLKALEYARHKANRAADSDDDEDATHGPARGAATVESAKRAIAAKVAEVHTSQKILTKHGSELSQFVAEATAFTPEERKLLTERIHMFKVAAAAVVQASDELVTLAESETRKLEKALLSEHSQRTRLQDQLETLAKQHSVLEREAVRTSKGNLTSYPFYSDEEEFHDAEEEVEEVAQDRKSGSSIHDGSAGDEDEEILKMAAALPSGNATVMSSASQISLANRLTSGKSSNRRRRSAIPKRPDLPLNLWSIMRNCIGKELSKIPMPVNFSEPLSVLQRITEDLEYAHLLDEAASRRDTLEQMCFVSAYAVSSYSTTGNRSTKPFNPLLGETYECDRTDDLGWRSIAEQVSHHPPAAAHHAEGRDWVMFQVTTTVHNIIVGKLWIDNHGDMDITNHKTGEKAGIKFAQYSYFSRDMPRKVHGVVKDASGIARYIVQGTWDDHMDMLKVLRTSGKGEKVKLETETPLRMWTVNPPYEGCEDMYHFTRLAIELNEPEDGVAPTDSRLRPDQRLMEQGRWDESNAMKQKIEEEQRVRRKKLEAQIERAMERGEKIEEVQPTWFDRVQDELTGSLMHRFTNEYWKAKEAQDWSKSPRIF